MKNVTLFLLIFTCCLSSCDWQRPLEEEELIYIGDWSSSDHFLEIAANGYGFCQRRNREAIEGIVIIRNDKIIIRGDNGRHKFDIDEPPFEEFGEVMMVLDGDLFYKH